MQILFDNTTQYKIDDKFKDLIYTAISATLNFEHFTDNVEISFSLVSNNEIKDLNFKYRNINRETDVLSFPMYDFQLENIPNQDEKIMLGDIIISIDKAIEQAKEYEHSIEREIGFLTVHSMLHLLGYDHIEKEDEKIMFSKQKEILEKCNLKREL